MSIQKEDGTTWRQFLVIQSVLVVYVFVAFDFVLPEIGTYGYEVFERFTIKGPNAVQMYLHSHFRGLFTILFIVVSALLGRVLSRNKWDVYFVTLIELVILLILTVLLCLIAALGLDPMVDQIPSFR